MSARVAWRIALASILAAMALAACWGSVVVSTQRALSSLEAALLNMVLWAAAAAIGWLLNAVYSEFADRSSLQERAKPAIRRLWELQRSAESLELMLARRQTAESHQSPVDTPEAVAMQMLLGQMRAAVQDWRELLPEDYVENVIADAKTSTRPNSLRWSEFAQHVLRISEAVDRSDAYKGFRPDALVGIYPEGGMVAYLMWLHLGRRPEVIVLPDEEGRPDDDYLVLVEKLLGYHLGSRTKTRLLVVDASIKSGNTMEFALTAVRKACGKLGIEAEIRSACVVDYPLATARKVHPDYYGVRGPFHLPFAES